MVVLAVTLAFSCFVTGLCTQHSQGGDREETRGVQNRMSEATPSTLSRGLQPPTRRLWEQTECKWTNHTVRLHVCTRSVQSDLLSSG